MNKLLILDGNSVLHRAYYALPDWRNAAGEATAGIYGFFSMLIKAIDELKPTHLVVVFDHPSPTFRHLAYVGYQHQREKDRQVSEDIWGQIEKLKEIFKRIGIAVFQVSGFEADDVIGSLATQSRRAGEQESISEVIIVTGDRDLMQLVNEKVKLLMPQKGVTDTVLVDEEKVKERLGIRPDQVVDYKGLVGDSSDNYPGVSGIGPKTAIELLDQFGNLENIYKAVSNAPSNPPLTALGASRRLDPRGGSYERVFKKLVDGYEGARLSQQLATIRTDAPVTLNMDEARIPEEEKILAVLKELGYRSLVKRVSGDQDTGEEEGQGKLF